MELFHDWLKRKLTEEQQPNTPMPAGMYPMQIGRQTYYTPDNPNAPVPPGYQMLPTRLFTKNAPPGVPQGSQPPTQSNPQVAQQPPQTPQQPTSQVAQQPPQASPEANKKRRWSGLDLTLGRLTDKPRDNMWGVGLQFGGEE